MICGAALGFQSQCRAGRNCQKQSETRVLIQCGPARLVVPIHATPKLPRVLMPKPIVCTVSMSPTAVVYETNIRAKTSECGNTWQQSWHYILYSNGENPSWDNTLSTTRSTVPQDPVPRDLTEN